MSLLDIFTGDASKDAAAANTAAYNKYQQQATGELDKAWQPSLDAVKGATEAWSPVSALGAKYGKGTDMYQNALGLNGPEGNKTATGAFQESPGYGWARDQAVEATARNANRLGAGGNEIAAVTDRANSLAQQEYGNWLTRLGGFMPQEASAATAAAGGTAAGKGAEAGLWQGNAQNKGNIYGNVASGIANSNTASANAQMNASGQFWNSLLNLGGAVAGAAYRKPTANTAFA